MEPLRLHTEEENGAVIPYVHLQPAKLWDESLHPVTDAEGKLVA